MKVVDRATFLAQPRGTLFCKVRACEVEPLRIKLDSLENDFIYRDLIELDADNSTAFADMTIAACLDKTRDELPLDWHVDMSRDGLFDADQMFAILDGDEGARLVNMLSAALGGVL